MDCHNTCKFLKAALFKSLVNNFQAKHLLSRLIFDSSTFCSACKIVRTQSLFTELLKSAAFKQFDQIQILEFGPCLKMTILS